MALDLLPSSVQYMKNLPRPSTEQRLVEVLRDNASLRQEIAFYRKCNDSSITMEDKLYDVSLDLMLVYHEDPEACKMPSTLRTLASHTANIIRTTIDEHRHEIMEAEERWTAACVGSRTQHAATQSRLL